MTSRDRSFAILEKALARELSMFMEMTDEQFARHIPNGRVKERVGKVDSMEVFIYSRDHDPPHFHVRSKDGLINIRFRIDNGNPLPGEQHLRNKVMKRIRTWYEDIKTKKLMEIWGKRNKQGATNR